MSDALESGNEHVIECFADFLAKEWALSVQFARRFLHFHEGVNLFVRSPEKSHPWPKKCLKDASRGTSKTLEKIGKGDPSIVVVIDSGHDLVNNIWIEVVFGESRKNLISLQCCYSLRWEIGGNLNFTSAAIFVQLVKNIRRERLHILWRVQIFLTVESSCMRGKTAANSSQMTAEAALPHP